MPIKFALIETRRPFTYQAIAKEALALHRLGMSASGIARALGASDKTITKAIHYAHRDASTRL
jgi:predicted transcriptional regulator